MKFTKNSSVDSTGELTSILLMIDEFSSQMKKKMIHKYETGFRGWDEPSAVTIAMEKLKTNIEEEDWVDVANLAAILWNME